jgi:hypothetical protein
MTGESGNQGRDGRMANVSQVFRVAATGQSRWEHDTVLVSIRLLSGYSSYGSYRSDYSQS